MKALFSILPVWVFLPGSLVLWTLLVLIMAGTIFKRLKRIAKRTRTKVDNILVNSIETPLILLLIFLGFKIIFETATINHQLNQYIQSTLLVFIIFSVVLFFDGLIKNLFNEYSKNIPSVRASSGILKTLLRALVGLLGMLIILDSLGISITPLVASLGVGSLAIALALQDTLANFFAGLHILVDKPVRIGDYIQLDTGDEGYVEKIGWRSTAIRMLPNNLVIIPNSRLATSKIVNYHMPVPEMSALVQVGVSYNSDLEKVEKVTVEVARDVLKKISGGVMEFEPFIRYHTFDSSSINFTVILRVKSFVDKYLITHEFIKALHKRYNKEGIVIPFPIRTVHLVK